MKLYGSRARVARSHMRAARLHRPIEALTVGPPRLHEPWLVVRAVRYVSTWLRRLDPAQLPTLPAPRRIRAAE